MSIENLNRLLAKKGGQITKKDVDAFYKSYTWQNCRGAILERDGYLCQICLEGGEPIPADTVHHIKHLRDDPTLALEDSNLISVCRECHEGLHPDRGNTNKPVKTTSSKIKVLKVKQNPERTW